MDEIYTKIQVYLMKKDKECDTLRFLTSKTTPSNAAHILDICDTMKTILQTQTVEKESEKEFIVNEERVKHYKFLLLNTNFRSQEYLCEDMANGHLVDMCPSLSPYLFLEIIWALNYDEILCNSILFIPMDLCSEILDTLRRCLDIDFQRAFNVVLKVIANCYKKLIQTINVDAQVLDERETLKRFLGSVQELLTIVPTLQSKKPETLTQLLMYERSGWVLMQILNTTRNCIELRRAENTTGFDKDLEKLYRVNFGRDFMVRLDASDVTESIDALCKEFIELLLSNVKKIDCFMYMGWAEIDYAEDTSMTMQRAVGLACHNFIEYLGPDKENELFVHLVECLEQLSSKPDAPFSMSIRELCVEVDNGNTECLRKLIERYEDWDSIAVSCLDKNRSLVQKDQCLTLLNSVIKFLAIHDREELAAEVYGLIMKIVLGQKLIDVTEIVVEFIVAYNASRVLESGNFEQDLNSHVNQGLALCSSGASLRIILFFIIQNPRRVLNTLIKTCVGYAEYTNSVMLPDDFCKLSPILQIRDFNNCSLLSNSLKEICSENIPWDSRKFINMIRVLLNSNLLTADDLLNDVFIPVLKNDVVFLNIQSILTCVKFAKVDLTRKLKNQELLRVLASQITSLRKNTKISMYRRDEMLNSLIRTAQLFAKDRINSFVNNRAESCLAQDLEFDLEPLDEIYFATQFGWTKNDVCLNYVLEEYKKRCFYVMNASKNLKNRYADIEPLFAAYSLETDDFLQHLILRCTEFEYLKIAKEALLIHWNYFGWENEIEAYKQFSSITIKVCNNCLTSSSTIDTTEFLSQKFLSLLKNLSKLTIWFINIDVITDYKSIYKSFVSAVSALDSSVSQEFIISLNKTKVTSYCYATIVSMVDEFDKFIKLNRYRELDNNDDRSRLCNFNLKFISMCLNWPVGKQSFILSKIDRKLYS